MDKTTRHLVAGSARTMPGWQKKPKDFKYAIFTTSLDGTIAYAARNDRPVLFSTPHAARNFRDTTERYHKYGICLYEPGIMHGS